REPEAAALKTLVAAEEQAAAGGDTAALDAVRAQRCTRQIQAIGRALLAYQKAEGGLPDQLWDLAPKYLPDTALLRCPADPTPGEPGYTTPDPEHPCSYLYELEPRPAAPGILLLRRERLVTTA